MINKKINIKFLKNNKFNFQKIFSLFEAVKIAEIVEQSSHIILLRSLANNPMRQAIIKPVRASAPTA